jgi:DNA modification methylase
VNLPLNTIINGLCLPTLKTLPDEFLDALVTDPPYGLGDKDPTLEEIVAYLQGADLDMGEFMNRDWELPSVAVWRECYRIMKPGAFLLCFAGTRTLDILSIGIRAAGFENRDCIPAEMGPPILRWIRAQGMPKSTDLGKEIRKINDQQLLGLYDGFGTALKPYWEPILMFRKPIKESSVVAQLKATGTGGINIEASRVRHSSKEDFEAHKKGVDAIKARGGKMANSWKNSSDLSGANDVKTSGRFPPNLVIVHSDLCIKMGTEMVAMPPINRFDDGAKPFGGGAGHKYTTVHRDDEEVEIWDCHHSCPVRWLNYHSGAVSEKPAKKKKGEPRVEKQEPLGASKYFFNVNPDSTFFYVPKPNQREKDEGLDGDEENEHVSVKPVRLMEYLVKMVTPPKGIVLDPYCGSGTTCVAAIRSGFDFIGIEKETPSAATSQSRVENALRERRELETQREAFELSLELESE